MTPEAFAAHHVAAFPDSPGPWTAEAVAGLMASGRGILTGGDAAVALGRVTADEAELLTIATLPAARRRGAARDCLARFEAAAAAAGAIVVFLEVAETNTPARALYAAAGYVAVGRRAGYYAAAQGAPVAALTLRKSLRTAARDANAAANGD